MISLQRESFINQYPPLNVLNKDGIEDIYAKREIHLYIHIPFCKTKCDFCYYLSFPLINEPVPEEYVNALLVELDLYAQMPQIQAKKVRTIYFGGGTPTLLNEKQLLRLIQTIFEKYSISEELEFCFEAGPDINLSWEKVNLMRKLGVNRISIGCQSTDTEVLKMNGRYHTPEIFFRTYNMLKEAEFPCINVDIMSGLIGQSYDSFLNTIDDILNISPQNISIYKLEIYLNNKLYKRLRGNEIELCSDDMEIVQVREGYKRIIQSGYTLANHFSFYSDKKYDHIHRREIWNGAEMLGIGLSSHSSINGYLYQNEAIYESYLQCLNKRELPIKRCHKMTINEKRAQKMILGLKTLHVNREKFYDQFGADPYEIYKKQLDYLSDNELITVDVNDISLTSEGVLFADDIVKEFYLPEHKKMSLAHAKRPNTI